MISLIQKIYFIVILQIFMVNDFLISLPCGSKGENSNLDKTQFFTQKMRQFTKIFTNIKQLHNFYLLFESTCAEVLCQIF